ncbi:MAG: hypothetical protein RLZZ385_1235 [Pseudomonadota bacterium]|jgi:hypothetical protein
MQTVAAINGRRRAALMLLPAVLLGLWLIRSGPATTQRVPDTASQSAPAVDGVRVDSPPLTAEHTLTEDPATTDRDAPTPVTHAAPPTTDQITIAIDPVSGSATPAPDSSDAQEPETQRLSGRVFAIIEEVQARQLEGQWDEALNEMNALYNEFESLNSFEQVTLLNYYTNALLALNMWPESITAFEKMLTVQELRPDIQARALLSLGQLNARFGDRQAAKTHLQTWLVFTEGMEGVDDQQTQRAIQLLASLNEDP